MHRWDRLFSIVGVVFLAGASFGLLATPSDEAESRLLFMTRGVGLAIAGVCLATPGSWLHGARIRIVWFLALVASAAAMLEPFVFHGGHVGFAAALLTPLAAKAGFVIKGRPSAARDQR